MKPFRTLGTVRTPDGSQLTLHEHDGQFHLKLAGRQLMSTTSTLSERNLAEIGCLNLPGIAHPRILIGGLGIGFTLKRVLELANKVATVHVAELLPEVVAWNREFLNAVNGALLDDPRVEVFVADVYDVIKRGGKSQYDVILLDVDNGPTSFIQTKNARLYDRRGFGMIRSALKPGGRVAFWSAVEEPGFFRDLSGAGFKVQAYDSKAHERAKRSEHWIYVGEHAPFPVAKSAEPVEDRKSGHRRPSSRD
jgi:spermidine synthase